MSKNFEEEYKTLANEELPDLWNRIEAGLTPKATALPENKKNRSFLYRYRTAAAAALCAIVAIPAAVMLGRAERAKSWEAADNTAVTADSAPGQGQGGAGTAAATGGAAEEAAEVAMDDSAEGHTDGIAEGMLLAPAGGVSGEGPARTADSGETANGFAQDSIEEADKGADAAAASFAARTEGMAEDGAMEEAENKELDRISDLQKESVKKESKEGTVKVYEKVTVQVAGPAEEMVETEKNLFCGVKMKVISDPSGELPEGAEITVWIAMSSSIAYVEGEEYTLDLSYSPDRDCPYRIA